MELLQSNEQAAFESGSQTELRFNLKGNRNAKAVTVALRNGNDAESKPIAQSAQQHLRNKSHAIGGRKTEEGTKQAPRSDSGISLPRGGDGI